MKNLVFYGSARKNGHTKQMLDELLKNLEGETRIVDAYREDIRPCRDCRYCWKIKGCPINGPMQDIYELINSADNIIVAAPMYFHSVSGPLKTIIDRCQVYWAKMMRGYVEKPFEKKGLLLLTGGAPAFDHQFLAGEIVLKGWLGDLEAECIDSIHFSDTDHQQLQEQTSILEQIHEAAKKLNEKR